MKGNQVRITIRRDDVMNLIYRYSVECASTVESVEKALEVSAYAAGTCTKLINSLVGDEFISLSDISNFKPKEE